MKVYDADDLRLAREMLSLALATHDGDEIYAARLYLREVKRGQEPETDDFDDE